VVGPASTVSWSELLGKTSAFCGQDSAMLCLACALLRPCRETHVKLAKDTVASGVTQGAACMRSVCASAFHSKA